MYFAYHNLGILFLRLAMGLHLGEPSEVKVAVLS